VIQAPLEEPRIATAHSPLVFSATLVFSDGVVPGGSQIIGYVAQAIIAYVDWGLDAQQAVAMPHLLSRFGVFEIEEGRAAEALADALTAKGFEVKIRGLNSGLHAIAVTPDGGDRGGDGGSVSAVEGSLEGGADPRREGLVLGR